MLSEGILIVQDVVEGPVVVDRAVFICLTIWVVAVFVSIVMLTDTIVVTEVETVSETFNWQLELRIDICEERVLAFHIVCNKSHIRVVAHHTTHWIRNNFSVLIEWICKWAIGNEEWKISLCTILVHERAKRLQACLPPLSWLYIDIRTNAVTLKVIIEKNVLLTGIAEREHVRSGFVSTRDVQLVLKDATCARELVPPVIVGCDEIAVLVKHIRVWNGACNIEFCVWLSIARSLCVSLVPLHILHPLNHTLTVHWVEVLGRVLNTVRRRECDLCLTSCSLL